MGGHGWAKSGAGAGFYGRGRVVEPRAPAHTLAQTHTRTRPRNTPITSARAPTNAPTRPRTARAYCDDNSTQPGTNGTLCIQDGEVPPSTWPSPAIGNDGQFKTQV